MYSLYKLRNVVVKECGNSWRVLVYVNWIHYTKLIGYVANTITRGLLTCGIGVIDIIPLFHKSGNPS